jgi:hypothetical protein
MTTNKTTKKFTSSNDIGQRNIDVVMELFDLYLTDIDRFYSLWVDDEPELVTPYVTSSVEIVAKDTHTGWDAVKAFWDPIHKDMKGKFHWYIDEIIVGEDPNVLVIRSHSDIDVHAGESWGNKHVVYQGKYVQVARFIDGKIKSFTEYYDTAQVAAAYS